MRLPPALLALFAVLGCVLPAAHAAHVEYGGVYWVVAQPAVTDGTLALESHAHACDREGLAATSTTVALSSGPWTADAVAGVASALSATSLGVNGCCTAGLWCEDAGGGLECGTQGVSDTYTNPPWFYDRARRPVYTCANATTTSPTSPAPVVAAVSPTNITVPRSAIVVDGVGFGTDPGRVAVTIGPNTCDDAFMCSNVCQSCTTTTDCGVGTTCVRLSSSSTDGVCLRRCAHSVSCPCGSVCKRLPLSSPVDACVEPNAQELGDVCTVAFDWAPAAATNLTSRLECTAPSTHDDCAASPPHGVQMVVGGRVAAVEPAAAAVTFTYNECSVDSQCPDADLCASYSCVNGCCVAAATGRCQTSPSVATGGVVDSGYVMVPAESAKGLPIPDVNAVTDEKSSVSDRDDGPLAAVPLGFQFPFYGAEYGVLYVSPNGYLKTDSENLCSGAFLSPGCALNNAYRGLLGPLITDFDPTAAADAVVSTRLTPGQLCVAWLDMPLWTGSSAAPGQQRYTTRLCVYQSGAARWMYSDFSSPPAQTTWMAGMRSSASVFTAADNQAFNRRWVVPDGGDVAVDGQNALLLSDAAIGDGNVAGVCAHHSVGCLSPRCGGASGTVAVRWGGVDCGPGFDTAIFCQFGTELVQGTMVSDAQGSRVECDVPAQPGWGAASPDLPVRVELLLSTPLADDAAPPGRGVGPDASRVTNTSALTPMNVVSVLDGAMVASGNVSLPDTGGRRLLRLQSGARQLQSGAASVVVTDLMYTYTNSGQECGCDLDPASVCDECGTCGGDGSARDCAGVCFGAARVDTCGVCAGGSTRIAPNADVDCDGVCFGSNTNCNNNPGLTLHVVEATSVVVIIALGCCLVALFAMCLWFFRVSLIQRRRRMEFEMEMALQGPQGMSAEAMAAIPVVKYEGQTPGGDGNDTCAVCLADLEEGDELRKIPCNHMFHVDCIDKWLERSVTCPMCKADLRTGVVAQPGEGGDAGDSGSGGSDGPGAGVGAGAGAGAGAGGGGGVEHGSIPATVYPEMDSAAPVLVATELTSPQWHNDALPRPGSRATAGSGGGAGNRPSSRGSRGSHGNVRTRTPERVPPPHTSAWGSPPSDPPPPSHALPPNEVPAELSPATAVARTFAGSSQ